MQWFYDGQIRRYITQTIRVLSNFAVKYGDGTLVRVPVLYGDPDRQAASIIRENSENKINAVPRIAVYITGLELDKNRLSDATYVDRKHFRERDINGTTYTTNQGKNYTVERLMPTPFKLTMKADIWTANTDQKLQVLEQILVLFNPSLELQTTDNYIDWTSLTVLDLTAVNWSSKNVPVGNDTPIDLATLTFETPVWISPPVKVKHLGVITNIISSIYKGSTSNPIGYIDGLGSDPAGEPTIEFAEKLAEINTSILNAKIVVHNSQVHLLSSQQPVTNNTLITDIPDSYESQIKWDELFEQYPNKYIAGSSMMYLQQPNGTSIVGTIAIDAVDPYILHINYDADTLVGNYSINSEGVILELNHINYNLGSNYRSNSPGTFDAIIDPTQTGPSDSKLYNQYGVLQAGRRYLVIEDIGSEQNGDGADAWKGLDNSDLIAKANDIIEWDGTRWNVIFNASQHREQMIWQTNIYTGIQYLWNGVQWMKSFEGEYGPGQWRLVL
jgi:hypothetical protein